MNKGQPLNHVLVTNRIWHCKSRVQSSLRQRMPIKGPGENSLSHSFLIRDWRMNFGATLLGLLWNLRWDKHQTYGRPEVSPPLREGLFPFGRNISCSVFRTMVPSTYSFRDYLKQRTTLLVHSNNNRHLVPKIQQYWPKIMQLILGMPPTPLRLPEAFHTPLPLPSHSRWWHLMSILHPRF